MKSFCQIICFIGTMLHFAAAQTGEVYLNIVTEDNVDFIVTNKWGKKTGEDPRGAKPKYDQIVGASYGHDAYGESTGVTNFSILLISPQDDGVFQINTYGLELTKYILHVRTNPQQTAQKVRININTFIDKDAEQIYKFTYHGNPSLPAKVEKVISISTLGQDFTTAGKLNLVGNQTYINSVTTKINQMVNFFHSGNKANAHNKLNDIKAQIQSAYFSPSSSQFVDEYAYAVLLEDVQLTFALIDYTGPIEEMRIKK